MNSYGRELGNPSDVGLIHAGRQKLIRKRSQIALAGIGLALSIVLALVDGHGPLWRSFLAYLVVSGVGALVGWFAWKWIAASDHPKWLLVAIAFSILLRLGLGIGLTRILPEYGNPSDHHLAGYIFPDSRARDTDAWSLADSESSLWSAFDARVRSDQYGGLLFLSASVYRFLSPDVHRPFLVIELAALFSALSTLFTWGFVSLTFGQGAAVLATWVVALYPESVLLGASQLREPFLIAGLGMTLYGYARSRIGDLRRGTITALLGIALILFFSPPFGILAFGIVAVGWVWEGRLNRKRMIGAFGGIVIAGLIAVVLTVRAWSSLGGGLEGDAIDLLTGWLTSEARYQLHLLERESGWVQKLFELTPQWTHLFMATLYGLLQPMLPAALMDNTGLPLMRGIIIGRSLGWFLILPFLIYAPVAALRRARWRSLEFFLAIVVWSTAILASYRSAGDQWDNPRYRAVFLVVQAALAGWAWVHARRSKSPWLIRTAVLVGIFSVFFIQWYAGRYYLTPSLNLEQTLIGIVGVGGFYLLGSLARDRFPRRKAA